MVKLRGHHLICLHFFVGEGYDVRFIENLKDVLSKAEIDAVEVVEGIDDVCKACPYNKGYCAYSEKAEKEIKEMDDFALKILSLKVGDKKFWSEIKIEVDRILELWKFYCKKCEWRRVCKMPLIRDF
ncbi:MAG: DUF1284 domain-containing protein [Archaeoglobaceae archaeon]